MSTFRLAFLSGYALAGVLDGLGRLQELRLVEGGFAPQMPRPSPPWWEAFAKAVARYAEGRPADFRFVPLVWERLTPYARRVLQTLQEQVGWGKCITYGALARMSGGSPRAVGQVMRRNPWVIVVPCHRVCAARGPGGYAYGTKVKQMLLDLERGVPLEQGGST